MTHARQALGAHGEQCAVEYLVGQGMVVLDRNWRCATGELDAILRDGDALVFAEVKTRRSDRFGEPVEYVRPDKARRLQRLAARWLDESGIRAREVRFDVVGVLVPADGAATVTHVRGAF
jgi:putative endonuclease